jgi:hypothetical protein
VLSAFNVNRRMHDGGSGTGEMVKRYSFQRPELGFQILCSCRRKKAHENSSRSGLKICYIASVRSLELECKAARAHTNSRHAEKLAGNSPEPSGETRREKTNQRSP